MSDRMEFWAIWDEENEETICLCKTEDRALEIIPVLQGQWEETLEIKHVEIIADVDLRWGDY